MSNEIIRVKSSLMYEDISDLAFRIFCILSQSSRDNLDYSSQREIAYELKKSRTTVIKAIKELEEKGYIIKEHRVLRSGERTTNCYYVSDKYAV